MSDIDVRFSLNYSPNPAPVNLDLGVSNTTLKVTLGGVPALAVTATPSLSSNPLSSMASIVATPAANAVTLALGAFAGNLINGRSFDVATVPPMSFNVLGAAGTLTPRNLSLSNFNGQLMLGGDFDLG